MFTEAQQDFVIERHDELIAILKEIFRTHAHVNHTTRSTGDVPLPLNVFVYGPAGTGKTATAAKLATELGIESIAFRVLTCFPTLSPDVITGPVDVSTLVLHNRLERDIAMSIFNPALKVVVLDEFDTLPPEVILALKSALTAEHICSENGCILSGIPFMVATSNASLEEVLSFNNIRGDTAKAILSRFPIRICFKPKPDFNGFVRANSIDVPATIRIGDDDVPTEIIFEILSETSALRSLAQFFALITNTSYDFAQCCRLLGIEPKLIVGKIEQSTRLVEVKRGIQTTSALLSKLPSKNDLSVTNNRLHLLALIDPEAAKNLATQPQLLTDDAVFHVLYSKYLETFFRKNNLEPLPVCEDMTLNEQLRNLVSKLRGHLG